MNEVIRIENLYKIYQLGTQQVNALDGVSLSINKNDYLAIMGPSGSGKSTMMNILGCLDTPTSGKYILGGTDVSQMEDGELADVRNKQIGFVFQSFNLLPRYSALENVALPLIYSGLPANERREMAERRWRRLVLQTEWITNQMNSPAVSVRELPLQEPSSTTQP